MREISLAAKHANILRLVLGRKGSCRLCRMVTYGARSRHGGMHPVSTSKAESKRTKEVA